MKATVLFLIGISILPLTAQAGDLTDPGVDKCVNAYYGIGETIDYVKAYQCFNSKKIWPYMIIMQLNGQGVPVNPSKAKQLMNQWDKADPYNVETLDHKQLRDIVTKHTQDKTSFIKKIDFCREIAGTTYLMDFCAGINDALGEQASEKAMDSIRAGLTSSQKVLWDEIQAAAVKYEKADAERIYQKYADGTIRGVAYEGQKSFIRDNFIKQMQDIFSSKKDFPVKQSDLKALDTQMRNEYQKDIDSYKKADNWKSASDSSNDLKEEYKSDIEEFGKDANESQQAWANLTNLTIKLAEELHPENTEAWSAKVMMTMMKARISDINNNPVCSNDC